MNKKEPGLAPVELGYCECTDAYRLESHFFPSKVGGFPAWLSFQPLPGKNILQCAVCKSPLCFLLQVYAPLSSHSGCFHRTLFVFICRNPRCCRPNSTQNVIVLRSQLPRKNDFYLDTPLDPDSWEDGKNKPTKQVYDFGQICRFCGCAADKNCSKCKWAAYCSKEHQEMDWKAGHKDTCVAAVNGNTQVSPDVSQREQNKFLFPEYELVTEKEKYIAPKKKPERDEALRLQDYKKYVDDNVNSSLTSAFSEIACGNDKDLEDLAKSADKSFKKFKERIEQNPDQVLRYHRGGKPLSPCAPQSTDVIPKCDCGAARIFEFQIMPHMLSYLDVDTVQESIDWATISVYTCEASCSSGNYVQEFVVKHDYTD